MSRMSRGFRFPLDGLQHLMHCRYAGLPLAESSSLMIPYPWFSLEDLARDRISMGTARFLVAVLWLPGPRGKQR